MSEYEITAHEDRLWFDGDDIQQVCVGLSSIIDCFVGIKKRKGVVAQIRRIRNYEKRESYSITCVYPNYGSSRPNDEVHVEIIDRAEKAIEGIEDEEYVRGYKEGSGKSWVDVKRDFLHKRFESDEDFMRSVGEWLLEDEPQAVCNYKNAVYPITESGRRDGSYVRNCYKEVANECRHCGADLDEYKEVVSTSNRTTVPTKYKCNNCNGTWKGITTG